MRIINIVISFIVFLTIIFIGSVSAQPDELNYLGSAVFAGDFYDLAFCNGYVWLADGRQYYNGNLKIFDVSDPENPQIVAAESYPGGSAFRLEAAGDRMYVSVNGWGVLIYDGSDPTNPILRGEYTEADTIHDMSALGDLLFLTSKFIGLTILEVSDPEDIQVLHQTAIPGGRYSLAVNEDSILTIASGSSGLLFYDVSDPFDPQYLATIDLTQKGFHDVVCDNEYAYAIYISTMINSGGFAVVDLTNPPDFEIISQPTTFGVEEFPDCGLWLEGDTLYFAATQGGMGIWDVSIAASPSRWGGYGGAWLPGTLAKWSTRATSGGGHAYSISPDRLLTPTQNKMYIFDIGDLTNPQPIGDYDAPDFVKDVKASGDYAYVAASTDGLITVDISDPSAPQISAVMDIFDLNLNAKSIICEDNLVYLSGGWKSLAVISVVDPYDPELIGEYDDFIASHTDMDMQGDVIAVTGDGVSPSPPGWLRLIDVSIPESPQPLSIITFTIGVLSVDMTEEDVYLGREDGFQIFNISNPVNPIEMSFTASGNLVKSVLAVGNVVFVGNSDAELVVMEVLNPADPRPVASLDLGDIPQDMALAGDTLFVTGVNTLFTIDISDPENPLIEDEMEINGIGSGISVEGNRVFLADFFGMHIYSWESAGVNGDERALNIPSDLSLKVYPNPFNNSTVISFLAKQTGNVELGIYNILGQKVYNYNRPCFAGERINLKWDGVDSQGLALPSAIYLIELQDGLTTAQKKIELLR